MGVVGELLTGGALPPAVKFERVGDKVSGTVVSLAQRQDHVFEEPEKLLWWNRDPGPARGESSDRPKWIYALVIETDVRDSDEDDGLRTVWVRSFAVRAMAEAISSVFGRDADDDDIVGAKVLVEHHELGKKAPGSRGQAPKMFRFRFKRAQVSESLQQEAQSQEAATKPKPAPKPATTGEDW